jgi:hypothetical protein
VAKTRAQRKAEQRRKAAQGGDDVAAERDAEARAQHNTEVGKTGVEIEAELAERGANLDELTGEPEAPAPSRADVGKPVQWRVGIRGDTLVSLQHISDGKIIESVTRQVNGEVVYERPGSRRKLALTILRVQPGSFDATIWRL